MKKVLLSLLSFIFCSSLFAIDIFSFVPVTGNVKNYTQIDYDISSKFGSYYKAPIGKVLHTLNVSGKEIETTELTPGKNPSVINKTVISYDVYGNKTGEVAYTKDDLVMWSSVISYKDNKMIDISEYGKDNQLKAKIIYTYDETTNLMIDETGYNGDGALVWKVVYKYDDNKRVVEENEYSSDGALSISQSYTYKSNGKIESVVVYDAYTKSQEIYVFRYKGNDQLAEVTTFGDMDKTNIIGRYMISYDTVGNVAKVTEYNVAQKFGTTVNELVAVTEYLYTY